MLKYYKYLVYVWAAFTFCMVYGALANDDEDVHKTFKNIDRINIKAHCNNVEIITDDVEFIEIFKTNKCRPQDACITEFDTRGNTLYVKGKVKGTTSGCVELKLIVPYNMELVYSSTSGSLTADKFIGIMEVRSTSGDVDLRDCRGEFDIALTSGDIQAEDIVLNGYSNFTSTSGNVKILLKDPTEYDLNVGSTTGRAILDFAGNPYTGTFELSALKGSGSIKCPVEPFSESKFRNPGGQIFYQKSFTAISKAPVIKIGTSTGSAILK